MNEWMNKWTNEQMNEQMNACMQMNEWMKEWTKEGMNEWICKRSSYLTIEIYGYLDKMSCLDVFPSY